MREITRREFLRVLALGLGAFSAVPILEGCTRAPRAVPISEPATSTPETLAQPASEPAQPQPPTEAAEPSATPASTPDLALARGGDDPALLVERALAALGGMSRFVFPGATVLVKPNICVSYHTYEYAATTNPWVVAALVRLALEAGASHVRVLDYPFGGSPDEAYARSGIQDQVEAAGGTMVPVSGMQFLPTDIPQGLDLRSAEIHEQALQSDILIDVPIAKNHGLAVLTLGMKNLMGLILDRQAIHRNLGQRLADLTSRIRPTLTVIDAVRILTANGPTGGNLDDVRKLDTIIASPDIVAADAYASTLFGMQPSDLAYVNAGAAMGLGRSDLASLRIEEIAVGG